MNVLSLGDDRPVLPRTDEYWIAPGATVVGRVELKKNASVWYGAVVRADVERVVIGENTNIQDCSVIHADPGSPTIIADWVTVGHMVMLHGCTIGEGSLIGIGAVVLNGAKIGRGCLIGAKALITENKVIPDFSVVMGAPGRVIRTMSPDEAARLKDGAARYVENWRRHARDARAL